MLRALSSSALPALLTITLFWGGCISCPQFFMFSAPAKKDCCGKAGKCERPAKSVPEKECKRMPLEPQGFGAAHAELAATFVSGEVLAAPVLVSRWSSLVPHGAGPVEHSPPDSNVLHSTFLV